MREIQIRSQDLSSIRCQFPEWEERNARATFRREYIEASPTDDRHFCVLGLVESESEEEANAARWTWLDARVIDGEASVVAQALAEGRAQGLCAREVIDDNRHVPKPTFTLWEGTPKATEPAT